MFILSLFVFALPLVYADVEFTSPGAGTNVAAGTINVQWKNSGKLPSITDLKTYTLALMVGGNDASDMEQVTNFVLGGSYGAGNTASGTIPAGIAGPVPNGFFFQMTSTTLSGDTIINYSDRFSITGLTGTTASKYRQAAAALKGDTSGPHRSGDVPSLSSSSSSSSSASATSTPNSKATVTVTTGPSSSSTPTSGAAQTGNGIDTGIIAAIVIASLAFLAALTGFAVWAIIRRRRRRDGPHKLDDKDDNMTFAKQPSVTALSELGADGRERVVEIGDGAPPPEMDSTTNIVAELPGDFEHEPLEMVGTPVVTPLETPSGIGTETWVPSPLSTPPMSRRRSDEDLGSRSPVTPLSRI